MGAHHSSLHFNSHDHHYHNDDSYHNEHALTYNLDQNVQNHNSYDFLQEPINPLYDSLVLNPPYSFDTSHHTLDKLYNHNIDCDTAYPLDSTDPTNVDASVLNLPENAVCNIFENHDMLPDVKTCLMDLKNKGVGFVERHAECFLEHFSSDHSDYVDHTDHTNNESDAIDTYFDPVDNVTIDDLICPLKSTDFVDSFDPFNFSTNDSLMDNNLFMESSMLGGDSFFYF